MEVWDDAQLTFLTAAAKVYAALRIANPAGDYSSNKWCDLEIDGAIYRCQSDCTGVIICIITLMGYQPNWPTYDGHYGKGMTEATSPFVKDKNGNISPDWEFIDFDPNDVRSGDIRSAKLPHSHVDIFVDYIDDNAYGLNAGSGPNTGGQAIPKSCDAGVKYLQDNEQSSLAATGTIQDNDAAKVLRYVKGRNQTSTSSISYQNLGQSLDSLDIRLQFIEKLSFQYLMQSNIGTFRAVVPGYFPRNACYPNESWVPANDSFGDSWLEFVADYVARASSDDQEWLSAIKSGLVFLYTLDNSDPFLYGRTVFLKEDGTNDYENSLGLTPIICTQFPLHFRCVVTNRDRTKEFGRSSAFFTTQSDGDCDSEQSRKKAFSNFAFLTDASGKVPEGGDEHGYLFIHDIPQWYETEEYMTWIKGLEEE